MEKITKRHIPLIAKNPTLYKWNPWVEKIGPKEREFLTEILIQRPELVLMHSFVMVPRFLGFDEDKLFLYGKEGLHEDYIMWAALSELSGYAAYRIYPPGSFVLDETYISVQSNQSLGSFDGFSDSTTRSLNTKISLPIEKRSKTIDKFINNMVDRWPENPIVYKTENNLFVESNKRYSQGGVPALDQEDTEQFLSVYNSMREVEALAKSLLKIFKMYLDECGIQYRK